MYLLMEGFYTVGATGQRSSQNSAGGLGAWKGGLFLTCTQKYRGSDDFGSVTVGWYSHLCWSEYLAPS